MMRIKKNLRVIDSRYSDIASWQTVNGSSVFLEKRGPSTEQRVTLLSIALIRELNGRD
jgi:hypothetical protein